MSKEMKFGKYTIELSNENKVLFPDDEYTKGDLINYFKDISDIMIPYLEERPMVMLVIQMELKGKAFFTKMHPIIFPTGLKQNP